MIARRQPGMAAVAIVVDVAAVAGGAAAADEIAQMVIGGIAALAAENRQAVGRRAGIEPDPEPPGRRIPAGIGRLDRGAAAGRRRSSARPPAPGPRQRRGAGGEGGEPGRLRRYPGSASGGEERIGEQRRDAAEPRSTARSSRARASARPSLPASAIRPGGPGRLELADGRDGARSAGRDRRRRPPDRRRASSRRSIACSSAAIRGIAKRSRSACGTATIPAVRDRRGPRAGEGRPRRGRCEARAMTTQAGTARTSEARSGRGPRPRGRRTSGRPCHSSSARTGRAGHAGRAELNAMFTAPC